MAFKMSTEIVGVRRSRKSDCTLPIVVRAIFVLPPDPDEPLPPKPPPLELPGLNLSRFGHRWEKWFGPPHARLNEWFGRKRYMKDRCPGGKLIGV